MNLESHAKAGQELMVKEWEKKKEEERDRDMKDAYTRTLENDNFKLSNKLDEERERREELEQREEARKRDEEYKNNQWSQNVTTACYNGGSITGTVWHS